MVPAALMQVNTQAPWIRFPTEATQMREKQQFRYPFCRLGYTDKKTSYAQSASKRVIATQF